MSVVRLSTELASIQTLGYDRRMYPILLELGPLHDIQLRGHDGLGLCGRGLVAGERGWPLRAGTRTWLRPWFCGLLLGDWSVPGCSSFWRIGPHFWPTRGPCFLPGAGFVWHGGLIGGIAGVSLGIRHYKLPWPETMDAIAPAIALGHGTGRIGCHLAGDGDWGPPTDLPWGMAYPDAIIGWDYPPDVFVHPTPLYEMAAYFAIAAVLWNRRTAGYRPGSLFWGYLLLAGIARFFLEFVRVNPPLWGALSLAQVISIGLMLVGASLLLFKPAGSHTLEKSR